MDRPGQTSHQGNINQRNKKHKNKGIISITELAQQEAGVRKTLSKMNDLMRKE